jgi:hypothetical protein
MTADKTTLDEEERKRVNNNHEDLESLLANREADVAMDEPKMVNEMAIADDGTEPV